MKLHQKIIAILISGASFAFMAPAAQADNLSFSINYSGYSGHGGYVPATFYYSPYRSYYNPYRSYYRGKHRGYNKHYRGHGKRFRGGHGKRFRGHGFRSHRGFSGHRGSRGHGRHDLGGRSFRRH